MVFRGAVGRHVLCANIYVMRKKNIHSYSNLRSNYCDEIMTNYQIDEKHTSLYSKLRINGYAENLRNIVSGETRKRIEFVFSR